MSLQSTKCPKHCLLRVACVYLPVTLLGLGVTGCSAEKRYAVSGTVSLDGQPLAEGVINLVSTSKGTTHGASIENGTFEIDSQPGLLPDVYQVSIEAWETTGKRFKDVDGEGLIEERKPMIPARYNSSSILQADVNKGMTLFEYELKSD